MVGPSGLIGNCTRMVLLVMVLASLLSSLVRGRMVPSAENRKALASPVLETERKSAPEGSGSGRSRVKEKDINLDLHLAAVELHRLLAKVNLDSHFELPVVSMLLCSDLALTPAPTPPDERMKPRLHLRIYFASSSLKLSSGLCQLISALFPSCCT
ncbi:hypothetical protein SAY87_023972 [Trapa incisa]|uniref:Uncharacterized protein n=1 Tax=Trapa incisa TaxID=236973 RepID=A0AAN7QSN2_9MYRT|nr:hypothetical protein SAY87_023972 [Trapa incisa]